MPLLGFIGSARCLIRPRRIRLLRAVDRPGPADLPQEGLLFCIRRSGPAQMDLVADPRVPFDPCSIVRAVDRGAYAFPEDIPPQQVMRGRAGRDLAHGAGTPSLLQQNLWFQARIVRIIIMLEYDLFRPQDVCCVGAHRSCSNVVGSSMRQLGDLWCAFTFQLWRLLAGAGGSR